MSSINLQEPYAVGSTRPLKTRLGAETLTALDLGIQLMTAPSRASSVPQLKGDDIRIRII